MVLVITVILVLNDGCVCEEVGGRNPIFFDFMLQL